MARRRATLVLAASAVALLATGVVLAGANPVGFVRSRAPQPTAVSGSRIIVGHSYKNDVSPALRRLPAAPLKPSGEEEVSPNPRPVSVHQDAPDPVVQRSLAKPNMPAPGVSFDGIGFPGVSCNCLPPDTDGEVGATQYVQMVNEGFQVFDKATGASLLGPVGISTLWTGFGGVCEFNGDGDPIVLYDQLADRWVISQFAGAFPNVSDECIAVSQTGNATGSYYRYGYHLGSDFFDYPHLGVWPDAYYLSMNVFSTSNPYPYLGPEPFAFNRASMLAGSPGTFITTRDPSVFNSGNDPFLPADLDGLIQPPPGAPNPFLMAGEKATWPLWRFHVDFTTPGNSTFTQAGVLTPASYTEICPGTRACVPQLGTSATLDAIGDRAMFRSAYRRFADGHEALVGNLTVDSGGVAGIRWWEINNATSGTPSFVQQSTYQPDSTYRWMGSAAMDATGDLALGFSASDAGTYPQIRYAGRLPGDPANTLGQGEATLIAGTGSQTHSSNRWGDYSDLTVDPVDDCTFWYTQEYYSVTTSGAPWRTRIGNFKFPSCSLQTLTAAKAGTGTGTISSTPDGISCGATCSFKWARGSAIMLAAAPDSGSVFTGWSGACAGTGACSFTLDADKSVTATFAKCVVPKVVGRKLAVAKAKIAQAFCKVGKIRKKKTSRRKRGRVLRQRPAPGTILNAYSKVNLTIGKK